MKKRQRQGSISVGRSSAHRDHLEALEDHALWLKDLERWRSERLEAIERLIRRLLPELELGNFLDALERHEAAILAHEELVGRHENRLRRERSGTQEHLEEADDLHRQIHERHELSRREHEQLGRSHEAILQALAMFERDRLR